MADVAGTGGQITIDGDLRAVVSAALTEGLARQSFLPTDQSTPSTQELRVTVRSLGSRLSTYGELQVDCGLEALCMRGEERLYESFYRGEFNETGFFFPPNAEANGRYVSAALSQALDQLFEDSHLTNCLAR